MRSMTQQTVRLTTEGKPDQVTISAEKLMSGDAATSVLNAFSDTTGQFHAGHWSSGVCKINVNYTENELCVIVAGKALLTDADGHAETYGRGDAFVIPAGFVGTWESVEPVTKIYAIFEADG